MPHFHFIPGVRPQIAVTVRWPSPWFHELSRIKGAYLLGKMPASVIKANKTTGFLKQGDGIVSVHCHVKELKDFEKQLYSALKRTCLRQVLQGLACPWLRPDFEYRPEVFSGYDFDLIHPELRVEVPAINWISL